MDEIATSRVVEVRFDQNADSITLFRKTLLSKVTSCSFGILDIQVKLLPARPTFRWMGEPTLAFLKAKTEQLRISKSKDGFTVQQLNEILETFMLLKQPVENRSRAFTT